jgi:transposase
LDEDRSRLPAKEGDCRAIAGVNPNTVTKVQKLARDGGEAAIEAHASRPGRPQNDEQDAVEAARAIVREYSHARRPLSLPKLLTELKSQGVAIARRTLSRRLHDAGMRYGHGVRRSHLHEDSAVVTLRAHYLKARMRNRRKHSLPKMPEVFLDESYCNLHHTRPKTWLDVDGYRESESGRGKRYCIVGAGVYWTSGDKLYANFVERSLVAWDSTKQGKKCHNIFHEDDEDLAMHMVTGESDVTRDYHGNFSAELFEFWFRKLCQTLQELYGQCLIHMDGAAYHKRRHNRPPTEADSVAEIKQWLTQHSVPFHPDDRKYQLLARIPAESKRTRFVSQVIAEEHGHKVIFTPPYHPELEPIEIIWAVIKNRIAANPAKTMAELGAKLIDSCRLVTETTWLGARKKTTAKEEEYWATVDQDLVANGEEGMSVDNRAEVDASVAATMDSNSEHSLV